MTMAGNHTQLDRPVSLWRRAMRLPNALDPLEHVQMVKLGDYDVTIPNASCAGNPRLPLSEREKQVLFMSACGKTGPEIAGLLNVTPNTVATYKSRILEKLGCHTIAEAVALATMYVTGARVSLNERTGRA